MLFSSIVFFFLFLPIILTVYLLLFWLVQRQCDQGEDQNYPPTTRVRPGSAL